MKKEGGRGDKSTKQEMRFIGGLTLTTERALYVFAHIRYVPMTTTAGSTKQNTKRDGTPFSIFSATIDAPVVAWQLGYFFRCPRIIVRQQRKPCRSSGLAKAYEVAAEGLEVCLEFQGKTYILAVAGDSRGIIRSEQP